MKNLQLVKLHLRNFKGIEDFTLITDGENVKVYGDNATGKTTIFDAFNWLLFDKDSQNKKDFQIKTVDSSGAVKHNLNHEVTGWFFLDSQPLILKKVYSEKWTKKRGSVSSEFSGHETAYFIDEVPSKKKEFTDLVSGIIDEEVFKLLTSPSYFNEQLHWEKRRSTLVEVCGDVSDSEVLAADKKLAKLESVISKRSIENHKKVVAEKRREINKRLGDIPVRIDEISRSLSDVSELNPVVIRSRVAELNSKIDEKETDLVLLSNGGEVIERKKRAQEIEAELLEIKNSLSASALDKINNLRPEAMEIQEKIDFLKINKSSQERILAGSKVELETAEKELESLREEWVQVDETLFKFSENQTVCSSCGQSLPVDKVDEIRAHAESHFNLEKSSKLERINDKGRALASRVEELKSRLAEPLQDFDGEIEALTVKLNGLKDEAAALKVEIANVETSPAYLAKKEELAAVKKEIETFQFGSNDAADKIKSDISVLKFEVQTENQKLAAIEAAEKSKSRIAELEKEQRDLAAEFERLEEELYLMDEFVRTKVGLIENKINSKFKFARFKLFSEQINGGLAETCETLYEGVPYSSGLNNAARINVGLDIINTLAAHYGFSAPIFVDNAEAVTKMIDVFPQVISLVVSESDKKLRVEKI